jgi:hypothetical protein
MTANAQTAIKSAIIEIETAPSQFVEIRSFMQLLGVEFDEGTCWWNYMQAGYGLVECVAADGLEHQTSLFNPEGVKFNRHSIAYVKHHKECMAALIELYNKD